MSGSAEGGGGGVGVAEGEDGGGAVVCADASGAAFEFIDGDGKGSAEHAGVVGHLVDETQLGTAVFGQGGAEDASAVLQHEVDFFGCYFFGSDDEVTFVFAVLVVNNDYEFTFLKIF